MERRDGAEGWSGGMGQQDGTVGQCSNHLAGPGNKRKGQAEPASWSKVLLTPVLPTSKDLAGVGSITLSPGFVSPALMAARGFMTSISSL